MYEGVQFAITVWTMREGLWLQLTMKDPNICRSGNGYLAAPLPAWQELRDVLHKLLPTEVMGASGTGSLK